MFATVPDQVSPTGRLRFRCAVKNVGRANAAELARYFVEKGKPLVVVAE
jgi:hypothetical protein